MKYVYATNRDEFGIVISNSEGGSISTIYHKPGCSNENPAQTLQFASDAPISVPETVPDIAKQIATNLGLDGIFHVIVNTGEKKQNIADCRLDEAQQATIADLLSTFNDSL